MLTFTRVMIVMARYLSDFHVTCRECRINLRSIVLACLLIRLYAITAISTDVLSISRYSRVWSSECIVQRNIEEHHRRVLPREVSWGCPSTMIGGESLLINNFLIFYLRNVKKEIKLILVKYAKYMENVIIYYYIIVSLYLFSKKEEYIFFK